MAHDIMTPGERWSEEATRYENETERAEAKKNDSLHWSENSASGTL